MGLGHPKLSDSGGVTSPRWALVSHVQREAVGEGVFSKDSSGCRILRI